MVNISASLSITFLDDYRQALEEYVLVGAGEEVLMQAYELGRRAVAEQRNILDWMAMHHDTMMSTAVAAADAEQRRIYLRRSEEFLAEMMAPFEMMHRGFVAIIRQLQEVNATLEQQVEKRTRALRESQRRSADFNLSLLLERIPIQIEAAKRSGMMVAMLLIDLVNFSDVNDTYGRHVGDSLLKQVGSRLGHPSAAAKPWPDWEWAVLPYPFPTTAKQTVLPISWKKMLCRLLLHRSVSKAPISISPFR